MVRRWVARVTSIGAAMDAFGYLVAGGLGALLIALLLIGHFYPGSGADVVDWKPTRSIETEIENEIDDVEQMLAAQNERRRRRGARPRSLDDVEMDIARERREQHARRQTYRAAQQDSAESERDLEQLLAATNARRRRRGEPTLTVEQYRAGLSQEDQGLSRPRPQ